MSNSSLTPPSPLSAEQENHTMDIGTLDSSNGSWCYAADKELIAISTCICVASTFGLLGNGTVIWLLGFCMKKNPFTTYILNLAVADFAVLISLMSLAIQLILISACIIYFSPLIHATHVLFDIMFTISQFLLTIISVDRCVSVLFPIWYRCHRPEKFSTILCAVIWILCFLLQGVFYMFETNVYLLFVDAFACLPLITVASLILVIKFCLKRKQHHRKKLLITILLTLFFFLVLSFPLKIIYLINNLFLSYDYHDYIIRYNYGVGYLCAALNSFVNPFIYYLVGRKKNMCKENLRVIFQRVFKQEEEVYGEELPGTCVIAQNS